MHSHQSTSTVSLTWCSVVREAHFHPKKEVNMRLLTHNMLKSHVKNVKNGFPLKIEVRIWRNGDFICLCFGVIPCSRSVLRDHCSLYIC